MMMEELTSDRHEAGRTAQPEFMRLGLEKLDAFQDEIADLEATLAEARMGVRGPAHVLSMDLAKCFDRMDLGTLRAIFTRLGLPICSIALDNPTTLCVRRL